MLSTLLSDLRTGLRRLSKRPLLAGVVLLLQALGIGANVAVFSLVDALLWQSVAGVWNTDEIVAVFGTQEQHPEQLGAISYEDFRDYQARAKDLAALAAFAKRDLTLVIDTSSERIAAMVVSDDYFRVLGVRSALGHLGLSDEEEARQAVLSHSFWETRFGADPEILGRQIQANGRWLTVIGVGAAGFRGTDRTSSPDLWLSIATYATMGIDPIAKRDDLLGRRHLWLELVGRLQPGMTAAQARSALETISQELSLAQPASRGRGVAVLPLAQTIYGPGKRHLVLRYAAVLMVVSAALLLVTCLNVASLLLAESVTRAKEVAIRLALGASPGRVARLLVTENLLLAGFAALLGLGVALAPMPVLERLRLPVTSAFHVSLNLRVLAFAFLLAIFSGILTSLAPVLRAGRNQLVEILKGATPQPRQLRWASAGEAFVALQVMAALVHGWWESPR